MQTSITGEQLFSDTFPNCECSLVRLFFPKSKSTYDPSGAPEGSCTLYDVSLE